MSRRRADRAPVEVGFSMEEWDDETGWFPMHEDHRPGVARVWRPRATAREAIVKCGTWTGRTFIPAMQVRDLATGEVVWRRAYEPYRRACGPEIEHPDEPTPEEWRALIRGTDDRPLALPADEQLALL